jgi:hypothetical protein
VPVILVVPAAAGAKSAVHLSFDKVQLEAMVPTPGFDDVKLTVPVGVFEALVVSGTVAVQIDAPPIVSVLGLHEILEDVASFA